MKERRSHGVVVIHGQSASIRPGEMLATVANGIATVLENAGGRVQREMSVNGGATGLLRVTRPGDAAPSDEFHFVDVAWSADLPAASAEVILRWMLKLGPREAWRVLHSLWRNAANDRFAGEGRAGYPAARWLRIALIGELVPITVVVALVYALAFLLSPLIYAIYMMTSVRSVTLRGVASPITNALHQLDPFLQSVLGESWRLVEDGMWGAEIRGRAEAALIAFYSDPTIEDITIIAYSAGAGVAYDALAAGRPVGEAAAANPRRLTLVTVGGALNRFYWLSRESNTSRDTRRFSWEPLSQYVTGIPRTSELCSASTDDQRAHLRSRFYWLNLFARMDFVPAGPLLPALLRVARVDPSQLKERPVINEDDLLRDHFGYFQNTDLVVPRLVRALYGGEYPWTGSDRWNSPAITADRVRARTRGVAWLDALRLTLTVFIVGWVVAFIASPTWRGYFEHDAGAVIGLNWGAFGDIVTVASAIVGPISIAYFLYSAIRGWWFDTI